MRRKRSAERKAIEEICARLMTSLEGDFVLTPSAISKRFGYANASTVTQIRKGRTIPDPARLAAFAASLAAERGRTINLHWVLTGNGRSVLELEASGHHKYDINKIIEQLPPSQREALVTLLNVCLNASK